VIRAGMVVVPSVRGCAEIVIAGGEPSGNTWGRGWCDVTLSQCCVMLLRCGAMFS
jgi:hypothetical protein